MFEEVRQILDNILGVAGNGFVERTNASGKNLEVCNGVAVAFKRHQLPDQAAKQSQQTHGLHKNGDKNNEIARRR